MELKSLDEKLMVQYLLGQLPEEEQARLEERAFTDQECMQEFLAVERDLIDEFVRGELSEAERRQFETHFLTSPERRQRVRFAKGLTQLGSESAAKVAAARPAPASARVSWMDSLLAALRGPRLAFKFSLAALIVAVVLGGLWLITENSRRRSQLAQRGAQERGPEQANANAATETPVEQRPKQGNTEVAAQPTSTPAVRPQPQKESTGRPPPEPLIATLVLPPGTTRSSENLPQLIIPRGARRAQLQVGLRREDAYQLYNVEVRTAGGTEIWSRKNLRARATGGALSLNLLLPANLLNTGKYELALKGVTRQGNTEDVGYYHFSVLNQ